ncbi:transcription factor-like 5 protein isoform X3 [Narcine bancroftii]|uniref:transcription factor-like 5 protein isoform X3 n=1 Tax=Narcine bancroftii TaxID=1343680 RepID=UPI00383103A2
MMLSSEATPEPLHSPSHDSRSSEPTPTTCTSECPFPEPGLNFTNSDLSLVDMSEVEYTQLQHILYSHMESQSGESELETRLNPTLYQSANSTNQAAFSTANSVNQVPYSTTSSVNQNPYTVTSTMNPTSDSHYIVNNQCLGHIDFQELKMMLLNDPPLPTYNLQNVEKLTQNSTETTRPNGLTLKNRETMGNTDKEKILGDSSMTGLESRYKTGPRVRLEDRFNAVQNENQEQHELQDPGVTFNNLVALIRHPSELMGMQQNKCTTLIKSKTGTSALQFAYPLYTPNTCTPTGSTSSGQTQKYKLNTESRLRRREVRKNAQAPLRPHTLPKGKQRSMEFWAERRLRNMQTVQEVQENGTEKINHYLNEWQNRLKGSHVPTTCILGTGNQVNMLESTGPQELALPRAFSLCFQQELQSARQALSNCNRNKSLPEQVWIKVEDETLHKQVVNKRCRNRTRQTTVEAEHKVLGDLTNMTDNQNANIAQGGQWHPTTTGPTHGNQQELNCQRRERHNRMERDRRRRIRICCDELNYLVPFCNSETDKATTLQWTTAFLKYIQEKHGDILKKEFESVFCGKTGRRLKQPRVETPVDHTVTTSVHNHGVMEGALPPEMNLLTS